MDEKKMLDEIVEALREGGYNPYEQLEGYLKTDCENYITRKNNARDKIKFISKELIKKEVQGECKNEQ